MRTDRSTATFLTRRRLVNLAGKAIAGTVPIIVGQQIKGQIVEEHPASSGRDSKIADLEISELAGHYESQSGANGQFQVSPLDIYDDLRREPYKESPGKIQNRTVKAIYLRIRTNGGA